MDVVNCRHLNIYVDGIMPPCWNEILDKSRDSTPWLGVRFLWHFCQDFNYDVYLCNNDLIFSLYIYIYSSTVNIYIYNSILKIWSAQIKVVEAQGQPGTAR